MVTGGAKAGKLLFLPLACIVLLSSSAMSQDVRVRAFVDSSTVLIGDWITLTLEAEYTPTTDLTWPAPSDSVGSLEVVRSDSPSVQTSGDRLVKRSTWIVTAFDSGRHLIPPLEFRYIAPGDKTARVAATRAIPIDVRGLIIDPKEDIRDIKPPLAVPLSFGEVLPYIAGAVLLAGLAWLGYFLLKKRRLREPLVPPSPSRPAHEVALEALRRLEAERLWQRGKVKEYHTGLTDIVRSYVERVFGIPAMEMTTEEILSHETMDTIDLSIREELKEILVRADLVKFAKFGPAAAENERSLTLAVSFVERTLSLNERPTLTQEVAQ